MTAQAATPVLPAPGFRPFGAQRFGMHDQRSSSGPEATPTAAGPAFAGEVTAAVGRESDPLGL